MSSIINLNELNIKLLCENIANSRITASTDGPIVWKGSTLDPESFHYGNKDERLGIDFSPTVRKVVHSV